MEILGNSQQPPMVMERVSGTMLSFYNIGTKVFEIKQTNLKADIKINRNGITLYGVLNKTPEFIEKQAYLCIYDFNLYDENLKDFDPNSHLNLGDMIVYAFND